VTEELCSHDAYLRECVASVTAVTDEGVVIDRTVCYARGGGQPGDTGTLAWDAGRATIIDTVRSHATGAVLHQVGGAPPPVGVAVAVAIDWDRRYTHMRTHTALHALSGIVYAGYGAKVTGGNMEPGGVARMDFELDAISQEFGRGVEDELNEALARDVSVNVVFLPRAEALADPQLIRTKVSLIPGTIDPSASSTSPGSTSRPMVVRTCGPPARSVGSAWSRPSPRARRTSACGSSSRSRRTALSRRTPRPPPRTRGTRSPPRP